jgi:hypothetical protein
MSRGSTAFGKIFEEAQDLGDGTLRLWFAVVTKTLAVAMIGYDWIKTRARDLVCLLNDETKYASECAYQAAVPKADAK